MSQWQTKRNRRRQIAIIILQISLALSAAYWVVLKGYEFLSARPIADAFDKVIWQQVTPDTNMNNPRWNMVKPLLEKLERDKPDRTSAISLLGEPDFQNTPNRLSYRLGFPSFLSMDPYTLDIAFSEEGRFLAVAVIQH